MYTKQLGGELKKKAGSTTTTTTNFLFIPINYSLYQQTAKEEI